MLNRRSFLQALGLGAATPAIDPERLLWTPGARTIFIPKPQPQFHYKYCMVDMKVAFIENQLEFWKAQGWVLDTGRFSRHSM